MGSPFPMSSTKEPNWYNMLTTHLTWSVHSHSLECVIWRLCSRYEQASGANLNLGKCHGLLVGSWAVPVQTLILLSSGHVYEIYSTRFQGRQWWWGRLDWSIEEVGWHFKVVVKTSVVHVCMVVLLSQIYSVSAFFWYLASNFGYAQWDGSHTTKSYNRLLLFGLRKREWLTQVMSNTV